MTGAATAYRNRAMKEMATRNRTVMTEETEVSPGCPKHELVGGLVRVVASCAIAFFYRLMRNLQGIKLGMANIAKFGYIPDCLEFVP